MAQYVTEEYEQYLFVIDFDRLNKSYSELQRILGISNPNQDRLVTPPMGIPGHKGVQLTVSGALTVAKNLVGYANRADKQIRLAYIELARQILYEAVMNAPIESGQLRESARATVGGRLVAKGTKTGVQPIKPDALRPSDTLSISLAFGRELGTRGSPEIKRYRTHRRLPDKTVVARTDKSAGTENDFLVAVWTHEDLQYTPNNGVGGPKYLENAMKNYAHLLVPKTVEALQEAVREIQGMSFTYRNS